MADEVIQDKREAANYLLRKYRDDKSFEFTPEEAQIVHESYEGKVNFLDSKPVFADRLASAEFIRSQDESDPTFVASEDEFLLLNETDPGFLDKVGKSAVGAYQYLKPVVTEGIPELLKTASMREPRPGDQPSSLPATLLEAGARGTMDLGMLGVGTAKFLEKAPVMAAGAVGAIPDYKSYLTQKAIDQQYQVDAIDKINADRAKGKSVIGLPEGTFSPIGAEAGSMFLDPTLAVPFIGPGAKAASATAKAGKGLRFGTKIAGGIESAARATGSAIDYGVEKIGQAIQKVIPGVTAPKTAGAIATGAAAVGIPGAFPVGAKVAAVRGGAEVVERGAQAARIAGEEAMTGPSRMTVMERVAKNQKNPEWLRRAANNSIVSSPITQGAAELGLETGKGAAKSAAVGAGLGYVGSGGEEEGIGGGLVIGGSLGALGGLTKGVMSIPSKKEIAKQGDVNRLFKRQVDLGLDVGKIADYIRKDNRPFLDAATLQMMAPDVQVEFHGRDTFMRPENAGINAAGVVKAVSDKTGRVRLLINMDDKRATGDTVRHEVLHAIQNSPAINKSEGRMAVMSEYGEEGLRRRANEYARKLLEGERQGRGTPTEAEVRAKVNEIREGSQRSEPGAGDLDWIADEILAEQFVGETRGRDLDSLRRKTLPGTNLLSLQEGYLAPVGRLLAKFGIDTTGPKPTNIDTLFKDNPLVPSRQLRELTSRWFRERDKYLDGLERAEKQKDVTLVPGPGNRNLANNPAIQFSRNKKTNLEENDFAVRFPDGTVRAKDPASILAVDKARVADVGRLYNPNSVLERGSPEFGVKIQSDGKPYVGGNTLPEGFYSLDSFNDFTKEVARALEDSRKDGKTYSVWYQKVGTGEDGSWAQSVKRGLGNIKVGQAEIAFLGWRLSKAGNILAQAVDISALRGRMLDFARTGKGRINEVWGGDLASYERDVMQYLDNHANSRPGETGIGIDKRNAINYLFGITNEANKNANPMYAAEGRPAGSLVKSYRLDRIANSRDTGRTGFFFDYQKQAANLAPGDYSMAIAIRDTMPDVADADQVKAILRPGKARGVNEEDLKWSNVMDHIDKLASEGNGKVRKEDMMKFLTGEGFVKINETVLKNFSSEPLSSEESKRLQFLESEYAKKPIGKEFKKKGNGAYQELMDLQNRRDNLTNSYSLDDMAGSKLYKASNTKAKAEKNKLIDEYQHLKARANRLNVVLAENRKNEPQYSGYQIPGGENPQEILLSKNTEGYSGPTRVEFPNESSADNFLGDVDAEGYGDLEYGRLDSDPSVVEFDGPIPDVVKELIARNDGRGITNDDSGGIFFGKHHGQMGVNNIAFGRVNERKNAAGKDILFAEELQSDWHQEGRKYGYLGENAPSQKDYDVYDNDLGYRRNDPNLTDEEKAVIKRIDTFAESQTRGGEEDRRVPNAPWKKDWPIRLFERLLRKSVDMNKKAFEWTKGATQFERWGSERVDWQKVGDLGYIVNVDKFTRSARKPSLSTEDLPYLKLIKSKEELSAEIDKQGIKNEKNAFSDKIWNKMQESDSGTSMPRKEGMEGFYDKILPTEIGKYMKQFGVKVKESAVRDNVSGDMVPTWSVDITPEVVAGVRKMEAIEKEISNYGRKKPKSGILGEEQKQFAPASPAEKKDEQFWVSQRSPKAVRATEDPIKENLTIGLDTVLRDKDLAQKQADIVKNYIGFNPKSKTAEGILREFVDHAKSNLLHLYDSFAPRLREEAKKWYDGARKMSEELSKNYKIATRQVAGVFAVLSPQKDWFMNISLAKRVIDIHGTKSNEIFTPQMLSWLKSKKATRQFAKHAKENLLGKRYSEIADTFDKAIFVRAFDEVNNSRAFDVYSPSGEILGKKLKGNGKESKVGWGSFSQIEKAISILMDGSKENIHKQLGGEHKVRNFFNNILQPNAKYGDSTIDTHAVAAALYRPLSGSSIEVRHNLGGGPSSAILGISGMYGLFAEAYRNAAKERGVLPREMQSITWEAIRGLFRPTFKAQAKNKAFVNSVWKSYAKGRISIDEARNTISKFAGGIEDPSWARRSGQVPPEGGSTANPGKLPQRGMAGQDNRGRDGRGVRGATSGNVSAKELETAVKSSLIKKQLEAKK